MKTKGFNQSNKLVKIVNIGTNLLCILLLVTGYLSYGQTQQESTIPNQIPPSPIVSSLGVFGDIPMDLATGIPNISIPIYELVEGDIRVPISLDYHASGIRVKDRSGIVGVKWALNAGGQLKVINGIKNTTAQQGMLDASPEVFENLPSDVEKFDFLEEVKQNGNYLSPEHYSYNILGKNGDFYIDANDELFHVPKKDYTRIDRTHNFLGSTINNITDEKGFVYYLGSSEQANNIYNTIWTTPTLVNSLDNITGNIPATLNNYTTAYFLDSIQSPLSRKVRFEYEDNIISWEDDVQTEWAYTDTPGNDPKINLAYSTEYQSKRLKRIIGSNVIVVFNYDEQENLNFSNDGGGQLKEILITDGLNTFKRYSIEYIYHGRFSIKKVNIYDSQGIKISDYEISYKDEESREIPESNSKQVDFYGYFNGQGSNITLVPEIVTSSTIYPGANRYIYPDFAKTGIIESIRYPTGGKSIFEFEPHSINGIVPGYLLKSTGYSYSNGYFYFGTFGEYETGNQVYQDSFTIPDNRSNDPVIIKVRGKEIGASTPTFYSSPFTITNNDTGEFFYLYSTVTGPNTTYTYEIEGSDRFVFTYELDLIPGTYTISLEKSPLDFQLRTEITWKELNSGLGPSGDPIVGGFRIKSHTNMDAYGNILSKKIYTYEGGMGDFELAFNHIFEETAYTYDSEVPGGPEQYSRIIRSSNSLRPGTLSGRVNYEFVNVTEEGNGYVRNQFDITPDSYYDGFRNYEPAMSNAYKRGRLLNRWVFQENSSNPIRKENYTYRDSEIEDEKLYDFMYSADGYCELFADVNGHPFGSGQVCEKRHYKSIEKPPFEGPSNKVYGQYYNYSYVHIPISSNYLEIKEQKVTDYGHDGEVLTTSTYEYNNIKGLVSTINKNDSKGNVYLSRFLYPNDYSITGSSIISTMLDRNMVGVPIETSMTVNGNLLAQAKKFDNDEGWIAPKISYFYKTNNSNNFQYSNDGETFSSYEVREQVFLYDNIGNPIELSRAQGPHINYIWAYNDQFPIAKIENSNKVEVDNAVSTALGLLSPTFATLEVLLTSLDEIQENAAQQDLWENFNTAFRSNLSGAMVTTYTYDPLIGVTSMTDPKGQTIYYSYYSFNRLKEVRDSDGNLVTDYEYHYINQP